MILHPALRQLMQLLDTPSTDDDAATRMTHHWAGKMMTRTVLLTLCQQKMLC